MYVYAFMLMYACVCVRTGLVALVVRQAPGEQRGGASSNWEAGLEEMEHQGSTGCKIQREASDDGNMASPRPGGRRNMCVEPLATFK